jgi:hypothetical protein
MSFIPPNLHFRFLPFLGLLVCLGAPLVGCSDDDAGGTNDAEDSDTSSIARDDQGFEFEPERIWLSGDLHVHATGASNDTGGNSTPANIKTTAVERGLDFVVLTDHSNSTGSDPSTREEDPELYNQGPEFVYWDRAAELSEAGEFLMVSGNEISPVESLDSPDEPRGHVGCIPRDLDDFDTDSSFTDRPPGDVTGGSGLEQANERGCFSILNHPYSSFAPHIAYDWTNYNYDAMEVWNGTAFLESDDMKGYDAWRCDLLQGRMVTPVGASDNHRINIALPGELTNPALGQPQTAVHAESFEWPDIIAALDEGRVTIFEGESRLYLDAYDDDKRLAEGADITQLRLRGTLDGEASQAATLLLRRAVSCDDPRPENATAPDIEEEIVEEWTIEPGDSFDEVVEVPGDSGVYTATLFTRKPEFLSAARHSAMSRAIVIESQD